MRVKPYFYFLFSVSAKFLNIKSKRAVLRAIKLYQGFISPGLGKNCRFFPSCSEYSFLAVEKYGLIKGCKKGLWRIMRCHPWNKGGVDLP